MSLVKQTKLVKQAKNQKKLLPHYLAIAALLFSANVFADQQDTLNFVAGVSTQHDNNLFKAPSNEESEQITSMFAGLRLDKQYSLQRFRANVTLTNNRYRSNDYLNFTSKNFDLAWLWALTPRLTGTISASRAESLNNFNDLRASAGSVSVVQQQNINTTQNQLFQADFAPGGGWHLLAGVSRNTQENSQTFNAVSSFSANSLDVGVKYDFASTSSITLMNHVRKGQFDDRPISAANLLDNGYKEREHEMRLNWILTAKSQLNLVASYLNRDHDNFSQRDFSGLQGGLTYNWLPTAKINVAIAAQSNLSTFQTDDASYARNNTFSISPSYAVTEKIRLVGNLSASKREFLGDAIPNSSKSGRKDTVKSLSVGVQWSPLRYLNLGFNVLRTNQSSNVDFFEFDDTVASLSADVLF